MCYYKKTVDLDKNFEAKKDNKFRGDSFMIQGFIFFSDRQKMFSFFTNNAFIKINEVLCSRPYCHTIQLVIEVAFQTIASCSLFYREKS